MKPPLDLTNPQHRYFVALDLPDVDQARRLIDKLHGTVSCYKIGYQLGYAGGLNLVRELSEHHHIFLDLKLHDIGNTVAQGIRSLQELGMSFLTVHAYPQTMRAAVDAKSRDDLSLLGVTVMTSYSDDDLIDAGYAKSVEELVRIRAQQALKIGIDGLICAPTDCERLRSEIGHDLKLVTPGVRPKGSSADDQKRIMTPYDAITSGADQLVIGRPITAAIDPVAAASAINEEISKAL